jgi:WD40 repeat protein
MDAHGGEQGIWSIAISPDGRTALSDTAEASMILWDLETGNELRRFVREDKPWKLGASGIDFLPDGLSAISADSDGSLIQWDVENGQQIRRLGQHASLRTRLAITPDGKLAVSAGMDGNLMVWDLGTGELIRHTDGHGVIFDLTMSPDGESVYFGSSDGSITQWRLSNPSLSDLKEWVAANRYLRELTCAEREIYTIEPFCDSQ